jgi:glycosyltransferase involved in cell wall biosynthesis
LDKNRITFVIPIFNNEDTLEALHLRIKKTIGSQKLLNEIVFVDDGSHDQSWQKITKIVEKNSKTIGIRHFKNLGQQEALKTGIEYAVKKGEYICTLDGDLENDPIDTLEMYELLISDKLNYVIASQSRLNNTKFYEQLRKMYYKIVFFLTGNKLVGSSYVLYTKKVANWLLQDDTNKNIGDLLSQNGFKSKIVHQTNSYRLTKSNYSYPNLFALAWKSILKTFRAPKILILTIAFLSNGALQLTFIFTLITASKPLQTPPGWASTILLIIMSNAVLVILSFIHYSSLEKRLQEISASIKRRSTKHIMEIILNE